jgi:ABC-type Mn2+/Zn2+ transport system ATPase subunit
MEAAQFMTDGDAAAVAVSDLSVAFGGKPVLTNVSFSVPPGAFVGVLGPNGAGKTTLLRALLGELSVRGQVEVEPPVAYVPQVTAAQAAFPIDALGVVLMGRYPGLGWWRRPAHADRLLAHELLDRMRLADRARSAFDELSGGQRQRVLLARALAQEGRVLLLDEPLSGTDAVSREVVLAAIREECAAGRTALMTTHDLSEAARVCDRLMLLNGELIAEGIARDIFTPALLRRAYGSDVLVLDGGEAVIDDPHHHQAGRAPWSG